MLRPKTTHELRCFCAHEPLLALYGVDEMGQIYIHIKSFKQKRLIQEAIIFGGTVRLHCPTCLRWQKVRIVQPKRLALTEDSVPSVLV